MGTIPEVYLDACVLNHSITDPNSLSQTEIWLKQQIPAIRKIIVLCQRGKLKVTHALSVHMELTKDRDKYNKIRKMWKDYLPNRLGGPNFVGPVSVPKEIFKSKPMYEERRSELSKKINDPGFDPAHLIKVSYT